MEVQIKLKQEFAALDVNRDGKVDRNEMLGFLEAKNIDHNHRTEIVDEIFKKCDMDGNGYIELDEFVKYYFDTSRQLEERNKEQTQRIVAIQKQIEALNMQIANQ